MYQNSGPKPLKCYKKTGNMSAKFLRENLRKAYNMKMASKHREYLFIRH